MSVFLVLVFAGCCPGGADDPVVVPWDSATQVAADADRDGVLSDEECADWCAAQGISVLEDCRLDDTGGGTVLRCTPGSTACD